MPLKKPSQLFESNIDPDDNSKQDYFNETYDKFKGNLFKIEDLQEKIEVISNEFPKTLEVIANELNNKITKEELDNTMFSHLMVVDENFKSIKEQVQGINKKDLREFKNNVIGLTEVVDNLVSVEIPGYRKRVTNSEVKISDSLEKTNDQLKEELSKFSDIIDGRFEKFGSEISETRDDVLETNNTYNKLYSVLENKTLKIDEKIENYSEVLEDFNNKAVKFEEEVGVKIEEFLSSVNKNHTTVKEKLENHIDNFTSLKEELTTDIAKTKSDIIIVEKSCNKIIDKFIKKYHIDIVDLKEDVLEYVDDIIKNGIGSNIERIDEKIEEIKEKYGKIDTEQLIQEGLLNISPTENNSDPLTPLDKRFVTNQDLKNHYRLFLNRIQQQLSTIGGGGETRLEFLDDVDRSTALINGKVLQYDEATKKWKGATASGIGTEDSLITSGIATIGSVIINGIGTALVVNGDAAVTGILTIGTASVTIDGSDNKINVGSATTIETTGFKIGNSFVHSTGMNLGTGVTCNNTGDSFWAGTVTAIKSHVGLDTGFFNEDLVVTGDARVTGILTVGGNTLTLDGSNNIVKVGTALTLGHTQGLQFHTQNLHASGFEVNNINVSGVSTLGHVEVSGDAYVGKIASSSSYLDIQASTVNITDGTDQVASFVPGGQVKLNYNQDVRIETKSWGAQVNGKLQATEAVFAGDVAIGGTLTYEDVTNIDSVGFITARKGSVVLGSGTTTTTLNVSGVSTFTDDVTFDGATAGRDIVFDRSESELKFADAAQIVMGAGEDFRIFHDGYKSVIQHGGHGDLYIRAGLGEKIHFQKWSGGDTLADFNTDGSVDLYYDAVQRFSTSGIGATVFGQLDTTTLNVSGVSTFSSNINLLDGISAKFGTDLDGEIKHTGNNLQIQEATGNIQITNYANDKDVDITSDDGSGGTALYFKADGSTGETILYNYGSEKIKTTSTGVSITGNNVISGDLDVDGNIIGDSSTNISGISSLTLSSHIAHTGDTSTKLAFGTGVISLVNGNGTRLSVVNDMTQINDELVVSGNARVTGVSTFAGITTVTGETLFTKQLNVSGVSTFAGDVSVGSSILFGDSKKLVFGASGDGSIYSDGNNFIIRGEPTGGTTYLNGQAISIGAYGGGGGTYTTIYVQEDPGGNQRVDLRYNGSERLATSEKGIKVGTGVTIETNGQATFTGIVTFGSSSTTIDGDNNLVTVGTALTLGHTQGLQFHTQNLHASGFELNQLNLSGISTFASQVNFDNSSNAGRDIQWQPTSDRLAFFDNVKATFGNQIDLQLSHNGSDSVISHIGSATGNLKILSGGAQSIECVKAGAVIIAHNGSTKLATQSTGVEITGRLGVGTDAPTAPLNVAAEAATGLAVKLRQDVTNKQAKLIFQDYLTGGNDSWINNENSNLTVYAGYGGLLKFGVYNKDAITIDSNRLVGVGTVATSTSSTVALQVHDATEPRIRLTNNTTTGDAGSGAELNVLSDDLIIRNRESSGDIKFLTGASQNEALRITSTGLVGIGSAIPQGNLDISGSGNDDVKLYFTTPTKTKTRIGYVGLSNRFAMDIENGLQVRDAANSYATRLLLDSAGKVGIGSEIPAEKLDVNGTIQCLNELRSKTGNDLLLNAGSANRDVKIQVNDVNMLYVKGDTGNVGIGTDSPDSHLTIKKGSSTGISLIPSDDTDSFQINFNRVGGSNRGFITYNFDDDYLHIRTGGSGEALRIGSSGQIGLGGANYGTTGQVLTSQGSGSAPIWSTSSAGSAANEIVVKDDGSNVGSAGTVNFGSGLDVSALSNGQVTITTTPGSGVPGISTIATSTFKDVVVTGVSTLGSSNGIGTVTVGVGTTALMVDGHARVTGPLTIGSGSITLDGSAEEIKIGNTFLKRDSSTGDLDVTDNEGNYKTIKMKGGNAVTQSDAIAFAIALG